MSCGANLLATTLLEPGVSDLTGAFRLYTKPCLENLIKVRRRLWRGALSSLISQLF